MPAEADPPLDAARAHRHFASNCFNLAWDYIDRTVRRPADDEAMVLAAAASLWHWTQRADCTAQNLSIGHWQLSRVYALAGQGETALRHALRSLEFAEGGPAFYVGYAHEAAARAAGVLGDGHAFREHLAKGESQLAAIQDESERNVLQQDLRSLTPPQEADE
jgi:hypothetical protein